MQATDKKKPKKKQNKTIKKQKQKKNKKNRQPPTNSDDLSPLDWYQKPGHDQSIELHQNPISHSKKIVSFQNIVVHLHNGFITISSHLFEFGHQFY